MPSCWSCFAAQSRLAEYTLFPPGHFDMVWASPVCAEYSRALTMRPRRLKEGDALVLRALRSCMDVTYCKYGTPYRRTNMRWSCAGAAAGAMRRKTGGI